MNTDVRACDRARWTSHENKGGANAHRYRGYLYENPLRESRRGGGVEVYCRALGSSHTLLIRTFSSGT